MSSSDEFNFSKKSTFG